jgi:lysine/ornithine N-monooxygenase
MKLLLLAPLLLLAACTSTDRESSGQSMAETIPDDLKSEQSTTEAVGETGRSHGYIRRFYQQNGQYYVDVDYVQFLSGEAAVAAARRKGDAAVDVVNGDTVYSVFNDYYVLNDNPQVRTLRLAPTATFTLWRTGENGLERVPATPAKLQADVPKVLTLSPFIIETENGMVVKADEQYVP